MSSFSRPIERVFWTSSFGLILSSVGAAVGIGNIWKFPYITYANGGGAFVVVYLFSLAVVGLPVMIAEMYLGKTTRANVYVAIEKLCGKKSLFVVLGSLCLFTAFGILSFYSVVTGWIFSYLFASMTGELNGLTSETVGPFFGSLVSSAPAMVGVHTVVMFLTGLITVKGTRMIEKTNRVLIPLLFAVMIFLASVSLYRYGIGETLSFLFNNNWASLSADGVLEAIGHSFFTLSVGVGATLIYGSYLSNEGQVVKSSVWIAIFDTFVAFLACFLIFPILFGSGVEVQESAAILFTSLTLQFNQILGGGLFSIFFYLLLSVAAITSTISLLEPVVAFVIEKLGHPRKRATILSAFAIWFVGLSTALGNGANEFLSELNTMGAIDYLTSNWTLPLGAAFLSLLCGFFVPQQRLASELAPEFSSPWLFSLWKILARYFAPGMILTVMLWKLLS